MTQTGMILEYVKKNGGITSKEAADYLGCMRLAARIADLEKEGYSFMKTKEKAKNRFGKKVFFTKYSLKGD